MRRIAGSLLGAAAGGSLYDGVKLASRERAAGGSPARDLAGARDASAAPAYRAAAPGAPAACCLTLIGGLAGTPLLSHHVPRRTIFVETNETPNPDCLRFFSMELSFLAPGQTIDLPNPGHAYKSPLAERLFALDGVQAVYFADEYITVTKAATADWAQLGVQVKEVIVAFAEGTESILSDEGEEEVSWSNRDTDPDPDDSEPVLAIKELLASRIRPMLRGDGGNVCFVGFEEEMGIVYVVLQGACKSCPSSGMTLKNGIERMLMHWVPEVTEVEEVDEEFAAQYTRDRREAKKQTKSGNDKEAQP